MKRDKPDGNAAELYENLAKKGWICVRIATAVQRKKGIPDSIVARRGGRRTHLLECKNLGGRMSAEQVEFARSFPGCVHVATSSWEANLLLEECEEAKP